MKLQQNQLWKQGESYILIVRLERLSVDYKQFQEISTRIGAHKTVTKKEFCRLIKGATLLAQEEIKRLTQEAIATQTEVKIPAVEPSSEMKS